MTAKPGIRALRPTHLVGLRSFGNRPTCVEVSAPSWPRVAEREVGPPLWRLLAHAVARPGALRRAWIHLAPDGIDGLIVGRARCGGLVWDVRELWIDGTRDVVAQTLLNALCHEAAARGARRVFLETSLGSHYLELASRAGFTEYTRAALHVCRQPTRATVQPLAGPRPRRKRDELPLFQLYSASVPANVRAAEALTLEEWIALYKGLRRWTPNVLTGRRQYVWETDDSPIAWMELAQEPHSHQVEWLLHPAHGQAADALVAHAVRASGGRVPLYATCREYQAPLEAAIERAGFQLFGRRVVFGRQLAVRIAEPALLAAPARVTVGR